MYYAEFFTDKASGLDTAQNAIHTFIRIPAAAGLFKWQPHHNQYVARTGANRAASIGENIAVVGGLWTALNHPAAFLVLLTLTILTMAYHLQKLLNILYRLLKTIYSFGRQIPINIVATKN